MVSVEGVISCLPECDADTTALPGRSDADTTHLPGRSGGGHQSSARM